MAYTHNIFSKVTHLLRPYYESSLGVVLAEDKLPWEPAARFKLRSRDCEQFAYRCNWKRWIRAA